MQVADEDAVDRPWIEARAERREGPVADVQDDARAAALDHVARRRAAAPTRVGGPRADHRQAQLRHGAGQRTTWPLSDGRHLGPVGLATWQASSHRSARPARRAIVDHEHGLGRGAGPSMTPHGPRRIQTDRMPRRGGGSDVVVGAVADVRDVAPASGRPSARGRARRRRQRAWRTPISSLIAMTSHVDAERPQLRGPLSGLVGDDGHRYPRVAQRRDAPAARPDRGPSGRKPPYACLHAPGVARQSATPTSAKTSRMLPAARDDRAERGHERQARDAQHVRPGGPDPGLVDERLTDVEADPAASSATSDEAQLAPDAGERVEARSAAPRRCARCSRWSAGGPCRGRRSGRRPTVAKTPSSIGVRRVSAGRPPPGPR